MLRFGRPFALFPVLALGSVAVTGGACGTAHESSSSGRAPGGHVTQAAADAAGVEAGEVDASQIDAGEEAVCSRSTLPLLIKPESDGLGAAPYKLYVPATTDEQSVVFLLDTGSPFTFLHEPLVDGGGSGGLDIVADAGSATLGCDQLTLLGAAVAADPPFGVHRVAGTLGDERLLARPVHLDFGAGEVVWHDPGVAFAGAATWPSTPFDRPGGYVRINDVAFDGVPVRMFVDTGSPDSVWIGQQGQPGDVEIDGEDSRGETIKMYLGTATVTIGAHHEKVPVFRVPSFPYLQEAVDALGGQLNGLFGLSSFPRGIVFDTDANVVRIQP
jgi:hypothetical protein